MKTYLMIFCIAVFLSSCSTNINCPAGYTGENCNIPFNEKYNGFYVCNQTGPVSGTAVYNIVLNSDDDILIQFRIGNLAELGFSENVTPVIHSDDPNRFSMVRQALGTTSYEVEIFDGVSNNSGNNISANYSIYNNLGLIETRSIVLTK